MILELLVAGAFALATVRRCVYIADLSNYFARCFKFGIAAPGFNFGLGVIRGQGGGVIVGLCGILMGPASVLGLSRWIFIFVNVGRRFWPFFGVRLVIVGAANLEVVFDERLFFSSFIRHFLTRGTLD